MEVKSSLGIDEGVIDFCAFLSADVKIVIFSAVEERVDGGWFDFDLIEGSEDNLVANCWFLDFHCVIVCL